MKSITTTFQGHPAIITNMRERKHRNAYGEAVYIADVEFTDKLAWSGQYSFRHTDGNHVSKLIDMMCPAH